MNPSDFEPCPEHSVALHGFIDGELDAVHALQLEQHLASCPRCVGEVDRLRALRRLVTQNGVRWRAPDHVRAQILDAVARESMEDRRVISANHHREGSRLLRFVGRWSLIPSVIALAASMFLMLGMPRQEATLQGDLVASHVRSLQVDHLTDVQTSDQHTVKPWFNGKVDFSPTIVDLTPQGFTLIGGRVDYIAGRAVAALVYRRHGHIINVFIWPAAPAPASAEVRDGFNLAQWSGDGLRFWAVSDLNAKELSRFRELFSSHVPP